MYRGSSPRVRGTVSSVIIRNRQQRFIPACAGNSCSGLPDPDHQSVHPRVCGEQFKFRDPYIKRSGSSPRVRGTGWFVVQVDLCRRFIPACAGNRLSRIRGIRYSAVHPRVCGEQSGLVEQNLFSGGSSPRVRGTARWPMARWPSCRFIPACAGNSAVPASGRSPVPVHPRVCGEQPLFDSNASGSNGSSPRVRGTVIEDHSKSMVRRFIPACAGNSESS